MSLSAKAQMTLGVGAAILIAGALTAAVEEEKGGQTAPAFINTVSEMTLGDTETATSPPTAAPVSVAKPGAKANVPCGFTDGC
jgi:hypothetical protein